MVSYGWIRWPRSTSGRGAYGCHNRDESTYDTVLNKDLMATENNPTPMGQQPGDLGPAVACNTSCVSLSRVNSFATDCFALTETVLVGFLSLASSGFFACTYQLFRGSMTVGIGLSEPGHSPNTHTDYILKVLERNNKCQPQRSRSRVFSRVIVELGFRCLSSTNSMPW